MLFTCLGSPGKPVVDTAGPLRMQPGDRVLLCSDGLWGALGDAAISEQLARQPHVRRRARTGRAGAAQRRAEERQRHRAVRSSGKRPRTATRSSGVSTQILGDEVFASTIQASLLGDAAADELDDAEIERSIREINEAIQRSRRQATMSRTGPGGVPCALAGRRSAPTVPLIPSAIPCHDL